jgi:hypothetical protein
MARGSHNSWRYRSSQAFKYDIMLQQCLGTSVVSEPLHVQRTLEQYLQANVMLWLFMSCCGCKMMDPTKLKPLSVLETQVTAALLTRQFSHPSCPLGKSAGPALSARLDLTCESTLALSRGFRTREDVPTPMPSTRKFKVTCTARHNPQTRHHCLITNRQLPLHQR